MGIVKGKGWRAYHLHQEYLQLRRQIIKLLEVRGTVAIKGSDEELQHVQDAIAQKVGRFKTVINKLQDKYGIAMEDLILLSIGVDERIVQNT